MDGLRCEKENNYFTLPICCFYYLYINSIACFGLTRNDHKSRPMLSRSPCPCMMQSCYGTRWPGVRPMTTVSMLFTLLLLQADSFLCSAGTHKSDGTTYIKEKLWMHIEKNNTLSFFSIHLISWSSPLCSPYLLFLRFCDMKLRFLCPLPFDLCSFENLKSIQQLDWNCWAVDWGCQQCCSNAISKASACSCSFGLGLSPTRSSRVTYTGKFGRDAFALDLIATCSSGRSGRCI